MEWNTGLNGAPLRKPILATVRYPKAWVRGWPGIEDYPVMDTRVELGWLEPYGEDWSFWVRIWPDEDCERNTAPSQAVLAWMELPKKYRGDRDNAEPFSFDDIKIENIDASSLENKEEVRQRLYKIVDYMLDETQYIKVNKQAAHACSIDAESTMYEEYVTIGSTTQREMIFDNEKGWINK